MSSHRLNGEFGGFFGVLGDWRLWSELIVKCFVSDALYHAAPSQ